MKKRIIHLSTSCLFVLSAALGQGVVPVDPATGSAQVNIPLWTLHEGNLSIPVGLNYLAKGVPVDQLGGSAGIGWYLTSGGSVSRSVKGLPDDINTNGKKGWLIGLTASNVGLFSPSSENPGATNEDADWSALNAFGYNIDTEPDIFSFSGPGLHGRFVFGNDKLLKLIPYQDLKISVNYNADYSIASFDITTNRGVLYHFDKSNHLTATAKLPSGVSNSPAYFSTTYEQYKSPVSYTSSWNLSSITGPSGENITFQYTSKYYGADRKDVKIIDEAGTTDLLYYMKYEVTTGYELSSISTALNDVNFYWDQGVLSYVVMNTSGSSEERRFIMEYGYVQNQAEVNQGLNPRRLLFLKEVKEIINCSPSPGYGMTYNNVTISDFVTNNTSMPIEDKDKGRDLWGYYNGVANSRTPAIYYNATASGAERYRVLPLQAGNQPDLSGADRSINAANTATGALESFTYPNGVQVRFTYEPNDYYDSFSNTTVQGDGLRVKQTELNNNAQLVTTYSYTEPGGASSGRQLYPPVFAFPAFNKVVRVPDNLGPEGGILYQHVTVSQVGRGKVVYDYDVPAVYPQNTYLDWKATRIRYARQNIGTGEVSLGTGNYEIRNDYYAFPFSPNTNFSFQRASLLKQAVYNEGGTLLSTTSYTYQRITPGGVANIMGIDFEAITSPSLYKVFVYGNYRLIGNVAYTIATKKTTTYSEINSADSLSNTVSYAYSPITLLMDSISTTNSDGTVYSTRYKYAADYSFSGSETQVEAKAIYDLNSQNRHGTVIETLTRVDNGSSLVTGAHLTTYADYNGKTLPFQTFSSPGSASFQPSYSSNNMLFKDASYELVSTVDRYTSEGLPVSMHDNRHHVSSVIYSPLNNSIPVVNIAGAIETDVIFEDFETVSLSSGFGSIGNSTDAWSGKLAYAATANEVLSHGVNTTKGSDLYRITLRAKGNTATSITLQVKNGAVIKASTTLTYPSANVNSWAWLEGEINMSNVSNGYTFELIPDNALTLDDVEFYPDEANLTCQTYEPLIGISSTTNDTGQSGFFTYDSQHRVQFVLNQDKDVVQFNEYQTYLDDSPELVAAFRDIHPTVNTPITASAEVNCIANVTYDWYVDQILIQSSTSTDFTYSFDSFKDYQLTLTVSAPSVAGTVSSSYTATPEPADLVPVLKINGGATPIYSCDTSTVRTFQVLSVSGCIDSQSLTYSWAYKLDAESSWHTITGETNATLNFDIFQYTAPGDYLVKAMVASTCTNQDRVEYQENVTGEKVSALIQYINNEPCQ